MGTGKLADKPDIFVTSLHGVSNAGFCSWINGPLLTQYSQSSVIPGGTWYLAGVNTNDPPTGYGEKITVEYGNIQLVAKPSSVTPPLPPTPTPSGTCESVTPYRVGLIVTIVVCVAVVIALIYITATDPVARIMREIDEKSG